MNQLIIFDFNRTLYDPDTLGLMPDAITVLKAAGAKGYQLVLLSKAVSNRSDLVRELGLTPYFAEVMFAEQKSSQQFEDVALRYNADKQHSFVIGDRAQGELKYGHEAGWPTIWVKAGKFADELPDTDQEPTHTVSRLSEVLALI